MPEWNRWDIVEAHYAYCMDNHNGQGCPLYAEMCRIGRYFKPGPLWVGFDSLSDNAQSIYYDLQENCE